MKQSKKALLSAHAAAKGRSNKSLNPTRGSVALKILPGGGNRRLLARAGYLQR
jgi:hypothetical protein